MKTKTLAFGAIGILVVSIAWLVIRGQQSESTRCVLELRVGLAGAGDFATLDPAMAGTAAPIIVVWQVYDRLVDIAPDNSIKPMLARSFDSSDDLTEWRFQLREDAFFHGKEGEARQRVTAEDVRASIERALRRPGAGRSLLSDLVKGAPEFIEGASDRIEGISVHDDEIIFRLERPFAFLPERLSASFFSIVPAGTSEEPDVSPTGSGPFVLESVDRVTGVVRLRRNNRYWGVLAPGCPAKISIRVFDSEARAVEELRSKTIDWLEANPAMLTQLQSLEATGNIRLSTPPGINIRLVAFNMGREPFASHPELRRALNGATNRDEIAQTIRGAEPLYGPLPSHTLLPGVPTLEGMDQASARSVLAGLPEQLRTFEMLVQPGEEYRLLAELIRDQWQRAGVQVTLRQGQADFWQRVIGGDYELALAYFGPFVPVPEQYVWPYRSAAIPIPNAMRFSSHEFDAALAAYGSSRSNEQATHLAQAVGYLLDSPPAVWLIVPPQVVATRPDLSAPRAGSIPLFSRLIVAD